MIAHELLRVADSSYSDNSAQGMLRARSIRMPYMFMLSQRTGSTQSKAPALEKVKLQMLRQGSMRLLCESTDCCVK